MYVCVFVGWGGTDYVSGYALKLKLNSREEQASSTI